jgi:hypothetical protein
MALPAIEMPTTVPDWRVAPHDFTLSAPLAIVQFVTGESRRRRTTLGAPRGVQGELLCSATAAAALHDWFEDDLEAGVQPFAARLLAADGTREWWHARFVTPPTWLAVPARQGPLWRVSANLRLQGEPSTTGPA